MPLIRSPPVTLSQLAESVPTLENPETDKALARKELCTSPLYRNLLISPDGTTTALKINVRSDETFSRLLHRRNELRNKRQHGVLSPEERAELARVSQRFSITNSEHQARLRKLIGEVRAIKDEYGGTATLHLAGVPLIIADSIGFIRHDLVTFGIGVLAFLIVILALAFRKPRWVALPLLTCLATGIIMIGFLGLLDWPVTVISANFPSLLLIITLSLSVHLIVRYREVHAQNPQAEQVWLVREMVHSLFRSPILTVGVVFCAILFMFAVLFRNFKMAVMAIIPNIFAAVLVLGLMGWLNISLDLMTITIAAIIIGIVVDDTIHYVHRYMHEFRHDQEYWPAIKRSHASIGRALLHNVDHHTGFLDPCAFQFRSNHLFRAAYRARHGLRADRRLDATAPIERLLQTPRLPGDARAWLSSSEDRSKIMLTLSQWYNDLQRVELRLQIIASKQPSIPVSYGT